jgi:hypothetical protein
MEYMLLGQISLSFIAKFLLLCHQEFLLITARELWWMNQE